ncbi:MAG: hypothetical protein AAB425_13485, partial [Bdellovibrionota bacterium]
MVISGNRFAKNFAVALVATTLILGMAMGEASAGRRKGKNKRARVKVHKYSLIVKGKPKAVARVTRNVGCESGYKMRSRKKGRKTILACLKRGKMSESGKSCESVARAKSRIVRTRKGAKACVYMKVPTIQKAGLKSGRKKIRKQTTAGSRPRKLGVKTASVVTRLSSSSSYKPKSYSAPSGATIPAGNPSDTGGDYLESAETSEFADQESASQDVAVTEDSTEEETEEAAAEDEVVIEGDTASAEEAGESATTVDPELAEFTETDESEFLADFIETVEGYTDRVDEP